MGTELNKMGFKIIERFIVQANASKGNFTKVGHVQIVEWEMEEEEELRRIYPCLCLCFLFLLQTTKTFPRRLTVEHPSQIFLTEALTFIVRISVREGEITAGWKAEFNKGRAISGLPIGRVNIFAHCWSNDIIEKRVTAKWVKFPLKFFVFQKEQARSAKEPLKQLSRDLTILNSHSSFTVCRKELWSTNKPCYDGHWQHGSRHHLEVLEYCIPNLLQ